MGCSFSHWYWGQQPGLQATVRVSTSVNIGGSGTTHVLSELVLQSSSLTFCSSERKRENKTEKNKETASL
jgi:hypothetical protein